MGDGPANWSCQLGHPSGVQISNRTPLSAVPRCLAFGGHCGGQSEGGCQDGSCSKPPPGGMETRGCFICTESGLIRPFQNRPGPRWFISSLRFGAFCKVRPVATLVPKAISFDPARDPGPMRPGLEGSSPAARPAPPELRPSTPLLNLSRNQRPVQKWSTQNHASRTKKAEFRSYMARGTCPY